MSYIQTIYVSIPVLVLWKFEETHFRALSVTVGAVYGRTKASVPPARLTRHDDDLFSVSLPTPRWRCKRACHKSATQEWHVHLLFLVVGHSLHLPEVCRMGLRLNVRQRMQSHLLLRCRPSLYFINLGGTSDVMGFFDTAMLDRWRASKLRFPVAILPFLVNWDAYASVVKVKLIKNVLP